MECLVVSAPKRVVMVPGEAAFDDDDDPFASRKGSWKPS